jgi:hypothetical protein
MAARVSSSWAPLAGKRASIKEIPLDKIEFNPKNVVGALKNREAIEWLKNSLQMCGRYINHPIVTPRPRQGKWLCVAGESRIMALRELKDERFEKYPCIVLEGLNEEEAMAILALDNALNRYSPPIARAIEAYWLYRDTAKKTQNHEEALRYTSNVYRSAQHVQSHYVLPGWLLAHSHIIQGFMEKIGPEREYMDRYAVEQQRFIAVRLYMLGFIARPFLVIDPNNYLYEPDSEDLEGFDRLLSETIEVAQDEDIKKEEFELKLYRSVMDEMMARARRLEDLACQTEDVDYLAGIGKVLANMASFRYFAYDKPKKERLLALRRDVLERLPPEEEVSDAQSTLI